MNTCHKTCNGRYALNRAYCEDHENADKKSHKYSIHTMTLRATLSLADRKSVKERLLQYGEDKMKGYYTDELKKEKIKYTKFKVAEIFGFNTIEIVDRWIGEFRRCWMDIKINPRKMFHQYDHPFVYIADQNEIEKGFARVQDFLNTVGITEIEYSSFHLHRIDYCVNIDLQDRRMVKEYMRLIQKGAYPYSSKRLLEYSKSQKRYIPTQNSFTVFSSTFELSVYDKYQQFLDGGDKYSEDEIKEAESMVRIEFRAKRPKLRGEEKRNECNDAFEFLRKTNEIAQNNIPRYLKMAYGSGRFVRYKEAKRLIQGSSYKKKTKDVMLDILSIASNHDLQLAKLVYGKKFNKYMVGFNSLGISPITLTSNSVIWEMENPLFYIQNRNKNHPD